MKLGRSPRRGPVARDYAAQAEAWRAAHPEGYALFVRFARERAARGLHFGAKAIAERVRWEHAETLERQDADFALNNNLVAWIIRLVVRDAPEVRPFVEMRRAGRRGGSHAGTAREPAGTDGREAARNGKPGGNATDRRAENQPRPFDTATVPAVAQSSPGMLFESAPSRAGWRHA